MKKNKKISNRNIIVCGVVIFVLASVLFVLVSGSRKVTCTGKSDQSKNGYVLETKYVIQSRRKIVSKVIVTEKVTSKDKELINQFNENFNEQYSYNKKNFGGYDYKIDVTNDSVTANVEINYRKLDMKKFIEYNGAMKEYTKNNKLTLDGAKKLFESTGAVCR